MLPQLGEGILKTKVDLSLAADFPADLAQTNSNRTSYIKLEIFDPEIPSIKM